MKYIVLSFDDGKKDFFTNTLPILKKHGIPAVLNVVSNFANNPRHEGVFVTWDEIKICKDSGVEIANHSANHSNETDQIILGKEQICSHLGFSDAIGFASPYSTICKDNLHIYQPLIDSGCIKYIRSGNKVKRDGKFHIVLYVVYKCTKNKKIFLWYNRRNFIKLNDSLPAVFPSITSNNENSLRHIIYCIEKMPDNSAVIINFHCIVKSPDEGVDIGKWYNDTDEFEQFCSYLSQNNNISVITNNELSELI